MKTSEGESLQELPSNTRPMENDNNVDRIHSVDAPRQSRPTLSNCSANQNKLDKLPSEVLSEHCKRSKSNGNCQKEQGHVGKCKVIGTVNQFWTSNRNFIAKNAAKEEEEKKRKRLQEENEVVKLRLIRDEISQDLDNLKEQCHEHENVINKLEQEENIIKLRIGVLKAENDKLKLICDQRNYSRKRRGNNPTIFKMITERTNRKRFDMKQETKLV